MDYKFHQFQVGKSIIYLLELSESFDPSKYIDTLSEKEIEIYFTFKNLKRKKEYVATRVLKHSIFGYQEIKYTEYGAPYFENLKSNSRSINEFISISHSNNLVGFAANLEHPIGFDLELIHPKVLKLQSKFLTDLEINQIDKSSEKDLISCWSMKETMYKLVGKKELDFKDQLNLFKIENHDYLGIISMNDKKYLVNLHFFEFKNYIISINTSDLSYAE